MIETDNILDLIETIYSVTNPNPTKVSHKSKLTSSDDSFSSSSEDEDYSFEDKATNEMLNF